MAVGISVYTTERHGRARIIASGRGFEFETDRRLVRRRYRQLREMGLGRDAARDFVVSLLQSGGLAERVHGRYHGPSRPLALLIGMPL